MHVETAHDRSTLFAALTVAALASTQLALQLWQLTLGTPYVVSHLTIDDTYYYLQTAWLTKELGFVTFDGLHPTNGVQLPWFGISLALAHISPSKEALLFALLSLSVVLDVGCHLVLWKIGRILSRPTLAACLSALWLAASLGTPYSQGLENSLHALVFWWVVAQALSFLRSVERGDPRPGLLPLTLALVANAWVRLDSGLFSAVIYAGCIGSLALRSSGIGRFLHAQGRAVATSLLVATGGFAAQLAIWWRMGGSLLPISAVVKASGSHWPPATSGFERLLQILPPSLPPRFPPLGVGCAVVALLAALAFVWRRRGDVDKAAFGALWLLLGVGFGAYHAAVLVLAVPYPPYFSWYRTPLFVFWILSYAGVLLEMLDRLQRRGVTAATAIAVAASLAVGAASATDFRRSVVENAERRTYLTDAYDAALLLSAHSDERTVLAAWNTGLLAYFANRTFINLDGLVNSHRYYEEVLENPDRVGATLAYLREEGVDYIVDVVETEEARALTDTLTLVRSFTPPGEWQGWRMWRVRAEAPPLDESANADP